MANLRSSKQTLSLLLIACASFSMQACQNPNFRMGFPGMDTRDDDGGKPASSNGGNTQNPGATSATTPQPEPSPSVSPSPAPSGIPCTVHGKVDSIVQVETEEGKPPKSQAALPELASLEALSGTEPKINVSPGKYMYDNAKSLLDDAGAAAALTKSYLADTGAPKSAVPLSSSRSITRQRANFWAFKTAFEASEGRYPDELKKRRGQIIAKIIESANPLAAAAAYQGALNDLAARKSISAPENAGATTAVAALSEADLDFAEQVATGSRPDQLLLVYRRAYTDTADTTETPDAASKAHEYASEQACLQKNQIAIWPDEVRPSDQPKTPPKARKDLAVAPGTTVPAAVVGAPVAP